MLFFLDLSITISEIEVAIGSMQAGKTPGPDGYPTEFFKKFCTQLTPLLLSVFEESLLSQSLPCTMFQAVIFPIIKKERLFRM